MRHPLYCGPSRMRFATCKFDSWCPSITRYFFNIDNSTSTELSRLNPKTVSTHIVLAAVQQCGPALKYASAMLQEDPEIQRLAYPS